MTLIIAGDRSGAGKTTLTLALLAYLMHQGETVQSFKVGPDYIDPLFHSHITGRPCRNLDAVLTSPDYVRRCFAHHAAPVPYSVIEGVMGLFDGIPYCNEGDYGSTAHIARLLNLPVVLAIDCRKLSGSVAALVRGYQTLDRRITLAGVILNHIGSDRHLTLLIQALEPLNIPILGTGFRESWLTLPERHLGLVPWEELPPLQNYFDQLAHWAAHHLDWSRLLPLLKTPPLTPEPLFADPPTPPQVRLAIAQDPAFNFYYPDTLDRLTHLGFDLYPFSPLAPDPLPPMDGLYLGGGFPEQFAEPLSQNLPVRHGLANLIHQGLPTYGECGGLMYLAQNLTDFQAKTWPMVGSIPTDVIMTPQLTLGYRQAQVLSPQGLIPRQTLMGHEFHRSQTTSPPSSPLYQLQGLLNGDRPFTAGWHTPTLQASYLHIHWGHHFEPLIKFRDACLAFQKKLR